ncbi:MAG: transketolase C-terminal domain-containing protein [Campylobacterales bacterium]|nr:transketolase C-terminal domain-containing protein [Campylobacterales bacterium]
MRNNAANAVYGYCKQNKNGFLITGDAGFGVWDEFQKELPDQYINPGINEQATIGMAAGMALSGHKVFLYNIIPFVLYRCYEQVRNDICYQDLPIVLIGIGSGITYAPAGMTHYALEDIEIARTMPNLEIFSPSDPLQAKKAVEYAINSKNPVYIRVSKAGEPIISSDNADITKPYFLKTDGDIAIVFHGSVSDDAIEAARILGENGIKSALLSCPKLSISDIAPYEQLFKNYKKVFVVEEHFENGGFGSILMELGFDPIKIAIKNHFIHKIGNAKHLRDAFGISAEKIVHRVQEELLNG